MADRSLNASKSSNRSQKIPNRLDILCGGQKSSIEHVLFDLFHADTFRKSPINLGLCPFT
jgi:hypothetical protein